MMHLFGEGGVQEMEILAIQEPEVYNHTDPMTTYSQALGGRFHVLLRPTEQAHGGKSEADGRNREFVSMSTEESTRNHGRSVTTQETQAHSQSGLIVGRYTYTAASTLVRGTKSQSMGEG